MIRPEKLDIGILDTPIKKYKFHDKEFFVKHDDLTGSLLSGNKVRKLDYLLYQAKQDGTEIIITCGAVQSNHCRATVVAASMLGIKTKLFLFGEEPKEIEGNLFIDKVFNADITYLTEEEYKGVNLLMEQKKAELAKAGFKSTVIPAGASNSLGIWGYINFIDEIKDFIIKNNITGIITAAGSGGTSAGLLLGSALNNLPLKIYAVNVLDSKEVIRDAILNLVLKCKADYQINASVEFNNLVILDGYSEEGYTNIAPDKVKIIKDFSENSGVLFDPAYTGKAFYAFVKNFLDKDTDEKVLLLHSGGLFGVFAKKEDYLKK